jgi:adenylate kinase family enzyme
VRISIVGPSGSGKTTLGRRLAEALGIERIELDAINHQAGWRDLNTHDRPEFARRVDAATAGAAWVADGNYSTIRHIVWGRATDVVWLDLGPAVFMPRLFARSFMRALTKRELWNGNRETWRGWLDPDSPILFTPRTWRDRRRRYVTLMAAPEWAHLRFHRLRRPREVRALVEAFASQRAQRLLTDGEGGSRA